MCPQKKLTRGPEQYVSLIVARAAGAARAAFSNTLQIMIIIGAVSRTAFTLHSIVEGLRLASCEMLFLLLLVTCMRTDFHHFSSS